jgi:hypothetical protein
MSDGVACLIVFMVWQLIAWIARNEKGCQILRNAGTERPGRMLNRH